MRWLPKAIPFVIISIAIYFVCSFALDGVRILTSPMHGLDRPDFAAIVYGIGNRFPLGPHALMRLALFLGAAKLSVALIFAMYLSSRICSLFGHRAEHDILDAAAILVVTITVVAATPALLDGMTDLLSRHRLPLWLAGLAVTLSMIERVAADERETIGDMARRRRFTVYDVVLPPKRHAANSLRWDALRRSANINACVVR